MRAKTKVYRQSLFNGRGFFSGSGDGIVTVNEQPSRRRIYVFDEETMRWVRDVYSNPDGSYLIDNLDETRSYTLMGKDTHGKHPPITYDVMFPKVA